jgi:hypothetical protein
MAARSEFAAAGLEEEVALGGGAPGTLGEDRDVPLGVLNHLQTGWHLNRLSWQTLLRTVSMQSST